MDFNVVITQDEDNKYIAHCYDFVGCHAQGDSYEEAISNIKEAIELCLEEQNEEDSKSKFQSRFVGLQRLSLSV